MQIINESLSRIRFGVKTGENFYLSFFASTYSSRQTESRVVMGKVVSKIHDPLG